jgi:hypothetical protein
MISHGRYHTIATVFNPNFTKEGNSANAALITTAPVLLEALEIARVQLGEYRDGDRAAKLHTLNIIDAVLATAKGGAA